ncbi:MAG TPA: hypothetical protein VHW09_29145 [Bryobacteraceae bacterium]|jgi:hypothetical protein|nr:hypothetical protein [Bryobacteraceae bacterium]
MIQIDNAAADAAHYALSDEQSVQLDHDLNAMKTTAEEIAQILKASYGSASDIGIRSGEVDAALQRLRWALDRVRNAGSAPEYRRASSASQSC